MKSYKAIIIGSGMGGLACAAALAKQGHRVQVLEQHSVAGGLTQTFRRKGFTWDVGLHYLGEMGPGGSARKFLDWLSGGSIRMAPVGDVYDIVHFPDDFEIAFASPAEALKHNLKEAFPGSSREVDAFFTLLGEARRTSPAPFRLRALPRPLAWVYSLWAGRTVRKFCGRTIDEVLEGLVRDPRLRAVLTAQWGDHGGRPVEGSFCMHAMIMNHFLDGAFYPEGGSRVFADALVPVIEGAGGEVRVKSPVQEILVSGGRASGVRLVDGSEQEAGNIVSAIGARDTVLRLVPGHVRDTAWARDILSLKPSKGHLCLYLGFEGDIASAGATKANHWFYETWDVNAAVWQSPAETEAAPALFVSFPSLKDPLHDAGENQRHTGEVATWVDWEAFSKWEESTFGRRPPDYKEVKNSLEEKMLAQFRKYFPGLASMLVCHELSTPLSTLHFVRRQQGASYGLGVTPERFLSRSLKAKTPLAGLYLAGQDVTTPGVTGAMMGGVLAAAAIDPRIFRRL
jgi:all-trans-retinol 13,14-reductase